MSIVIGVKSIFGTEPQMVQKGLVMSYIVKLLENVATAKHLCVGMYWQAVTQLLLPVSIVLFKERSCKVLK